MKRDEFWRACYETLGCGSHGERGANALTAKAEAAGVKWDPEEELPERLVWDPKAGDEDDDESGFNLGGILLPQGPWNSVEARNRAAAEAVRRYNARPELRKLLSAARSLLLHTPSDFRWAELNSFVAQALAILDAKES